MGPNGSGKTSLLECIAGIRTIESGTIEINGVEVTLFPPEKRRVGYVPQDTLLFPHLTADQNIVFGSKNNGSDAGTCEGNDGVARDLASCRPSHRQSERR